MRNFIIFNGKNSLEYGIGIESWPAYTIARRRTTLVSVPGRSGDVLMDGGAYENIPITYPVWWKRPSPYMDAYRMAGEVAMWLAADGGYHRLEQSCTPEFYQMAHITSELDVSMFFSDFGRTTLEFSAMPQKFLKTGEIPIDMKNGGSLYNPWKSALPLIAIRGAGYGTLMIGNYTVIISDIPEGLMIDCDTQNAYAGSQNENGIITVQNGFPVLEPGENTIIWSGGVSGITITPRWWML